MAASFLLLDKRRTLQDGTYPVKVAVGHGTSLYLSTGVSVKLWEWDVENAKVVDRKDSKKLNALLEVRLLRVKSRLLTLREDGRLASCSVSRLRQLLTAPDMDEVPDVEDRPTLEEIFRECIATKDKESTRQSYRYTLDKVLAYTGGKPVHVEDLDRLWLHGFEASIGGKVNARAVHLRNLRHVCNYALDEEYTTHYPFRKFRIRTEETHKKDLTLEQLRAYATAEISYRNDAMHRDVFMLLFYFRGMNISDLADLTWKDVKDGRVYYRRNKTGGLYSVKIEPEAQAIIDRYPGKDYLLCPMDRYANHKNYILRMDKALKKVGLQYVTSTRKVGRPILPEVSSYWARHTWTTVASNIDIPMEIIGRALGHSWVTKTITSIYIDFDSRKVDDANRKVLNFVGRLHD